MKKTEVLIETVTPTLFKLVKVARYSQRMKNGTDVLVKPLTKRGIENVITCELVAYIPDYLPEDSAKAILDILNKNRTIVVPSIV